MRSRTIPLLFACVVFMAMLPATLLAQGPFAEGAGSIQESYRTLLASQTFAPVQPEPYSRPWVGEMRMGRMLFKFQPFVGQQDGMDSFVPFQNPQSALSQWILPAANSDRPGFKLPDFSFVTGLFQRHRGCGIEMARVGQRPGLWSKVLNQAFTWQSRIHISNDKAPAANSLAMARHNSSFFSRSVSRLMDLQ